MKMRRLTEAGLATMENFLDEVRAGEVAGVPPELLTGPELTQELSGSPDVKHQKFTTRFAFAAWVSEQLEQLGNPTASDDRGFWAWLSLFLFDQVCPVDPQKGRFVGADWRHIPQFGNYRAFYRHLLAGPYTLYRAHEASIANARALLVQPLHKPGEFVEQLASRRELATSPAIVGAATLLYLDSSKGVLKKGSGGSGVGSPRRFAAVVAQFDVTYDLFTLTPRELTEMLPVEFDRFKASA